MLSLNNLFQAASSVQKQETYRTTWLGTSAVRPGAVSQCQKSQRKIKGRAQVSDSPLKFKKVKAFPFLVCLATGKTIGNCKIIIFI